MVRLQPNDVSHPQEGPASIVRLGLPASLLGVDVPCHSQFLEKEIHSVSNVRMPLHKWDATFTTAH